MIKEGDRGRVLVEKVGIEGLIVPAGTVGTVVDAVHAPGSYAVDVRIGDRFDNIDVSDDQIETLPSPSSWYSACIPRSSGAVGCVVRLSQGHDPARA